MPIEHLPPDANPRNTLLTKVAASLDELASTIDIPDSDLGAEKKINPKSLAYDFLLYDNREIFIEQTDQSTITIHGVRTEQKGTTVSYRPIVGKAHFKHQSLVEIVREYCEEAKTADGKSKYVVGVIIFEL